MGARKVGRRRWVRSDFHGCVSFGRDVRWATRGATAALYEPALCYNSQISGV